MYKLCWVTLHVKDVDKSVAFYNGLLGLPICSRTEFPGGELAMLGAEDMPKVEVISQGEVPEKRGRGVSVGIEVGLLEEAMEKLKQAGVPVLRGPISPNPHLRFFFAEDPDGYEVQFVEFVR
jgi:lactoylglutathione lyase